MNRFWSMLFFLVPILGVATFLMAAFGITPFQEAWLPENYSKSGETIDHLFNVIHLICAAIFISTGLSIGWFVWKFADRTDNAQEDNDRKAVYLHGNWKLETLWTFVPGAILLFIAFYQMNAWSETKIDRPSVQIDGQTIPKPPMVLVRAKQFGWEFHYAGKDKKIRTQDDYYVENLLVIPDDETIVLQMESRDVIHSFFVPKLRLKQDVVPGMTQFAWFTPTDDATGVELTIICSELCGWGHSQMEATLKIVSRADFNAFVADLEKEKQPSESSDE